MQALWQLGPVVTKGRAKCTGKQKHSPGISELSIERVGRVPQNKEQTTRMSVAVNQNGQITGKDRYQKE